MVKISLAGFKLNMKPFFQKESINIIKAYKNLIARRQGVRLDDAPNNAPSTAKSKGKNHWLVNTGETKNRGFAKTITRLVLIIFASKDKHSGRYYADGKKHKRKNPPSYEKIFEWHNTAGGRYSGVFQELPAGSQTLNKMEKDIVKQFNKHIAKKLPKRVKIK